MKSKKSSRPIKQDKVWQEKVEKQVKVEGLKLGHPQGKERFEQVIKRAIKKKQG